MRIGIIGLGVVGNAIKYGFELHGVTVISYDKHKSTEYKFDDLVDTDCIFICVPTPTIDNVCDTSIVEQCIDQLCLYNYSGLIVIKSTVMIGTTQRLIDRYPNLRICFVPEFLRQDHAIKDFTQGQQVLIVGSGHWPDYELLVQLHGPFVKSAKQITPTEAEITKYFVNSFNALRVVFANAYYEICNKTGSDYQSVLASALTHHSVGSGEYLQCHDQLRGFAGACLPKDVQALATFVGTMNLPVDLFDTIIHDNKQFTKN